MQEMADVAVLHDIISRLRPQVSRTLALRPAP
eukprot:COSAG05_NODE_9798_length_600_cov_7.822604_1_plen_31_part_10